MSSLTEFLKKFKTTDKENTTHTSIYPSGKYNIPSGEIRKFYYLYNKALQSKNHLTILELSSSNFIPVIVDVDLKIETRDSKVQKRLYEKKHVKNIVSCFIKVLKQVIPNIKEEDLQCFLLERSGYIEAKGQKQNYKNGFHLHFPRIWLSRVQQDCLLIPLVEQKMKEDNIELPYGTTFHNVMDKAIYKGKGKPWFLYGSTKENPKEPYTISRVFHHDGTDDTNWRKVLQSYPKKISETIDDCLVDIFSIRGEDKMDFYYELDSSIQVSSSYIETNQQTIIENNSHLSRESREENTNNYKMDEWVDELLPLLPEKYYIEHDLWIHIGWILYNIYDGCDDGFYKWDTFSQQCPDKYNYNVLREEWNKMEKKNVTMGSLKFIVKKENPEEYKELCNKFTNASLQESLLQTSTTHFDIANILYNSYESQYVCGHIKNNEWYEFEGHTWKKIDDGNSLRKRISTDIVKQYEKIRNDITDGQIQSIQKEKKREERNLNNLRQKEQLIQRTINDLDGTDDEDRKLLEENKKDLEKTQKSINECLVKVKTIEDSIEILLHKGTNNNPSFEDKDEDKQKKKFVRNDKVERLNKIINNLKMTPFKKNIMTEAKDLFYEETFSDDLNANPWLIAFQNGVYDLKNHIFRDGQPEDRLSMRMAVNYREDLTRNSPQVKMAEDFFIKIFPNERIREFFLAVQSEIYVGRNIRKIFQIWTGVGDNGKSITQDIFEKMLGSLCTKLPTSLIVGKRTQSSSACPELERAGSGVRLCILQEPGESDKINMGILKELSGNDSFYARGLHKDPKDINPMFKLVMICNKPPSIPNSQNDQATWNRTRIIPFESKFPVDDSLVPETFEEQMKQKIFHRDPNFADKIPDMLEGVAWLLMDIYKSNIGKKIVEPPEVLEATQNYRKRDDYLADFVNEKIVHSDDSTLGFETLYDTFKDWYRDSFPGAKLPNKGEIKEHIVTKLGEPSDKKKWIWENKQIYIEDIN